MDIPRNTKTSNLTDFGERGGYLLTVFCDASSNSRANESQKEMFLGLLFAESLIHLKAVSSA